MRHLIVVIGCLLLSGCSNVFSKIKLDTLMTHKIETTEITDLSDYNGIISVDTIKELSIKAISTYFGKEIEANDANITVQFYDTQTTMQYLIGWNNYPLYFSLTDEQLSNEKIEDGIFIVTLKMGTIFYQVILTASSGEILEVSDLSPVEIIGYNDNFIDTQALILSCQNYIKDILKLDPQNLDYNVQPKNSEIVFFEKESKKTLFLLGLNPYTHGIIKYSSRDWLLIK